jgi:hypothetical protein
MAAKAEAPASAILRRRENGENCAASKRGRTSVERQPARETERAIQDGLPITQPEPRYRMLYRIQPDVVELTSFGKSTIYDAIARGELEVVHYRGAVRVTHEALVAFVAGLRQGGGEGEAAR